MSMRETPSSSHRYRPSDGSFKSYYGIDAHSKLIYDTVILKYIIIIAKTLIRKLKIK